MDLPRRRGLAECAAELIDDLQRRDEGASRGLEAGHRPPEEELRQGRMGDRPAEDARMQELRHAGVAEQMPLKAAWSGAVMLLRAADHAAARDVVGSLPLVTNGITKFELTEVISPPAAPSGG